MFTLEWVLTTISLLLSTTVGLAAFLGRSKSAILKQLGLFLLACSAWSSFSIAQSYFLDTDSGIFLVRATFVSALLMAYFMFGFASQVARLHLIHLKRALLAISILMIAMVLSPFVISGVSYVDGIATLDRTPLYFLVIAVLIVLMATSVAFTWNYARHLRPSRTKSQAQLITIGLVLGIVIGSLTNIILPNVAPELYTARIAWLPTIIWLVPLIYAVVRHGFLDVHTLFIRIFSYAITITSMIVAYCVLMFASAYWLGYAASFSVDQIVVSSAIIIILGLLFQPTKSRIDKLLNSTHLVHYSRTSLYAEITTLSSSAKTVSDLRGIVESTLKRNIGASFFDVCVFKDKKDFGSKFNLTLDQQKELASLASSSYGGYLELDPYSHVTGSIQEVVRKLGAALVYPLNINNQDAGVLMVGMPKDRSFTIYDRDFLKTTANELSIAIEKLIAVEEVRDFNKALRTQVNEATSALKASNKRLRHLDATKDEFLSMASHQLRTPLTSIKGYISMILEGDAGRLNSRQHELLSEAFSSSERMVHLIGDFLNVSRLQTGRFSVDLYSANLVQIVNQEVEGLKQIADMHGIKLVLQSVITGPDLYLDEGKVRQVIMNFIDNAIYYAPNSKEVKISLEISGGNYVFKVADFGIGVPKEFQDKLFTKFSRADNAKTQRPDGTGIGLYLAKRIIEGHSGKVIFESKDGKGSVFGFSLPIDKLTKPPVKD